MHELTKLYAHHVFLRRDALTHGYDDADISRAMKAQTIARVRWGAYTAFELWNQADPVARHLLRCHAVLLTHGDAVVLSHTSAALIHGLDCWEPDLSRVHLIRRDGSASRRCHDVLYHRGALPDQHIQDIESGGLMTIPARAALETATISTVEAGLVAIDSFLHQRKAVMDEIGEVHASRPSWPGNRRLNITLRLARPGAQSVGETRMRYLMWEYHLPEPTLQFAVTDRAGNLVGISDFAWEEQRLLGEFDGKLKYSQYLRVGETPADSVVREKLREDRMRETTGFSMVRFIWPDLYSRAQTAARLRSFLKLP